MISVKFAVTMLLCTQTWITPGKNAHMALECVVCTITVHAIATAVQYAPAKKREIALRLDFLFSWEHEHDFLKGVFLIFASSFVFPQFLKLFTFPLAYIPHVQYYIYAQLNEPRRYPWSWRRMLAVRCLPPARIGPTPPISLRIPPPSTFDTTIDSPPRLLHDVRELVLALALAVL